MSDTKQDQHSLLNDDRIMYSIIAISLPMMATGLVEALYNMVDSIFVGRFVGEKALAALTINSTIQNFLLALSSLYGSGMASIISRALGANNTQKVNDTIVNGAFLCFVSTLIFSLILLFYLDPILLYLGSSSETLSYSREYGQVILWFGFLAPTNGVMMGILRARGEVKSIMKMALLGASLNVGLDALFIVIFGWGVAGAAWATILAQLIVTVILIREIIHFYRVHFEWHYIKRMTWSLIKEIYSIGISNFLRVLTFVIMGISTNKVLALYGTSALAAYGIVMRFVHLAYQPIFGSNLGTQSLIGYNYGANRFLKVQNIIFKGITFATLLGIFPSLLFIGAPDFVFELFTDSPDIIAYTNAASKTIGTTFFLYGLQIFSSGALLAMGHPKEALFLSLLRPCLMVFGVNTLPWIFGISGVWLTFPFTDIFSTIATIFIIVRELKQLKKREEALKQIFTNSHL
ncbi:MAG: MATE family efflux transporter [Brevinema sp.]